MLKYIDAMSILMDEFESTRTVYDEDDIGYHEEDDQLVFYSDAFVPYILKQLNEENEKELVRIFAFIERLFIDGDDAMIGLARVSIVDDISYEVEFDKYKNKAFSLSGELTLKAFRVIEKEADEARKILALELT